MNMKKSLLLIIVSMYVFLYTTLLISCKPETEIQAEVPSIISISQDITTPKNNSVTLSVEAKSFDGGILSYHWCVATDKLEKGKIISEGHEKDYTPNVSESGSLYYYCEITNSIGKKTKTIDSPRVCVTVLDSVNANTPIIQLQPISSSVIVPAKRIVKVCASVLDGGSLTYQWYSIVEGESVGAVITGAVDSNYEVNLNSVGKKGYYCVVTNEIPGNGDGGIKTASIKTDVAWFEGCNLSDILTAPIITKQPSDLNIVTYDESIDLSCCVNYIGGTVLYQWYQSTDGTVGTGSIIKGATLSSFSVPKFIERGIRYYYCIVTHVLSTDNPGIKSEGTISNIATVAYTELPVVKIETVNGEEPTAEYVRAPEGAYGQGLKNATKVPARMQIFKGGQTSPVYDSNEYIKKTSGLTIKIRGNSSAWTEKKPYKLKLEKKYDLLAALNLRTNFDSKYEDKEWLLLKEDKSLGNFVGMTVADIAGVPWTPEFIYVNVIINGNYRGVYVLIESISKGKKRINIADDGYIIERDAYWWNEDVKFITERYNQKYTFKYPDDDDIQEDTLKNGNIMSYIEGYMETVETSLSNDSYDEYLDVDSFARWLLIHDILGTGDPAGSNQYMTKYDSSENTKLTASTTWDYDYIYKMKNKWTDYHNANRMYVKTMLASNNTAFKVSFKEQWNNLSDLVCGEITKKLDNLKITLGEDINISRKVDSQRWSYTPVLIEENINAAKNWFSERKAWLDLHIDEL